MSHMTTTTLALTIAARKDGRGYYANVKDPRTGARRQLSFPTEPDGQRFLAIYGRDGYPAALADYERLKSTRGDRSAITSRSSGGRTVTTAALDYIASRKSPSTRRNYRQRLTNVLALYPDVTQARVDRLTRYDLEVLAKWLNECVEDGAMARSVAFNAWAFLSQTLNREVREGRIVANPCGLVEDRPRPPTAAEAREAATIVDDAEAAAIIALAPSPVTNLLYRLLYASAARLSEGLALGPRHVKLEPDAARLVIERTWAHDETGGGWHLGPTKGKNTRTVYVARSLGEELLALGVNPATGCLNLPTNSTAATHWAAIRDEAARLGLAPEGVRIHDLRHSRITNLLEAGASPVAVSRMAGHASVQFTLDRYGHVRDDAARALASM